MRVSDLNGCNVEILQMLLLYSGKYTYLPDLYDILGKDKMMELIDTFAGVSIQFPTLKELKSLSTEVEIYSRLKSAPKGHRATIVKDISDQLKVCESTVLNIFDRAQQTIEHNLGMEVILGKRKIRGLRGDIKKTPGSLDTRREQGSGDSR